MYGLINVGVKNGYAISLYAKVRSSLHCFALHLDLRMFTPPKDIIRVEFLISLFHLIITSY